MLGASFSFMSKNPTCSGRVCIEDPPSTCADCPLADKYGGRGAMTVRLEHGGKVYGLSSVSIPAHFLVDEEEQTLFEEVTADIGFALHSIELEDERKQAEEELKQTMAELVRSNAELEHFNRLAVGRELRMVEIKRQIKALSEELGREPPYDISFAEE